MKIFILAFRAAAMMACCYLALLPTKYCCYSLLQRQQRSLIRSLIRRNLRTSTISTTTTLKQKRWQTTKRSGSSRATTTKTFLSREQQEPPATTPFILGGNGRDNKFDDTNDGVHRVGVASLLSNALSRAERTLSYLETTASETTSTSSSSTVSEETAAIITGTDTTRSTTRTIPPPLRSSEAVTSLLSKVTARAERNLSTYSASSSSKTTTSNGDDNDSIEEVDKIHSNYGQNPTITSTALGHSLWSYVIRPGIDCVIDATAGNGGDSLVLAQMLFQNDEGEESGSLKSSCQLICVDVSKQACENTYNELEELLPREVLDRHVQVLNQSHTPLPLPTTDDEILSKSSSSSSTSIGLVVYNLGYLPNLKHMPDNTSTETETTLASLADAAKVVRIGGMISVMTYPRSHREEDAVVRAFLHGLALFSSTTTNYRAFIQEQLDDEYFSSTSTSTHPDNNNGDDAGKRPEYLRQLLLKKLEQISENNVDTKATTKQTWRVYEHHKIGWTDAPILVTATRIK